MSTCVCDFGESKLCLKCYSCKMSEPFLVEDHPEIDNQKTSLEMKSELDNAGVDVGEAATEYELEEIHDAYVTNKCVDRFRDNTVLFPIFKASYYGGMIGAHIMKFDLKEGGRFIADDRLTPKLLSDVVNLFHLCCNLIIKSIQVSIVRFIKHCLLFLWTLPMVLGRALDIDCWSVLLGMLLTQTWLTLVIWIVGYLYIRAKLG